MRTKTTAPFPRIAALVAALALAASAHGADTDWSKADDPAAAKADATLALWERLGLSQRR